MRIHKGIINTQQRLGRYMSLKFCDNIYIFTYFTTYNVAIMKTEGRFEYTVGVVN